MGLFFGRRRRSSRKGSLTSGIPFLRFLGPGTSAATILAVLFMLVTGRIDLSMFDKLTGTGSSTGGDDAAALQPVDLKDLGQKSPDTVRIATFNIQVFGKTKSSNQEVMNSIAYIVSQFDVIAIQEVRGGDAVPIQRLVDLINASGGRYTATVSEPIGRTSQTESYAFVWDKTAFRSSRKAPTW